MEIALSLVVGLFLGGIVAFLFARLLYRSQIEHSVSEARRGSESELLLLQERVRQYEERLQEFRVGTAELERSLKTRIEEVGQRERRIAEMQTLIEQERKSGQEKLRLLEEATVQLKESFSVLANEALKTNNEDFLKLAKTQIETVQKEAQCDFEKRHEALTHLLSPVKETFQKFDKKIEDLEKERSQAYGGITEQMKILAESHLALRTETGKLVNALRRPQARGRWGEIQLRNVVELAGMTDHCDFCEQVSVEDNDGLRLRPDLIVSLPGGKKIVVDSKVSLDAFMNAIETEDEQRRAEYFAQHAQQVRAHVSQLSRKEYWGQFAFTPDFVVLFLPGEVYFSAALREAASLIEEAARNRVVLASPTTLIALLKAVAYGWQQEKVAENAREIAELGKELHDRICTMAEHFEGVGKNLKKATECYNKSIRSLDTRVLTAARKFQDLRIGSSKGIPSPEPVEVVPQLIQADESLFEEEDPEDRQARMS